MTKEHRELTRLLRQIRVLLALTLIGVIVLVLAIAYPYRRDEVFGLGSLAFVIVVAFWIVSAIATWSLED